MKCNQAGPGFELVSPCPYPATLTITPRAPPFDWGWYGGVLYGLHPIFPYRKLRSSSQNFCALLDTKVFGMPFLLNMTLRICFIVEPFLSGTRITSGQPEKESTLINKNPTPVMYAWSICTLLHGSTSLGHECKVVCVKFLNSLNFFASFYIFFNISWISRPPCFWF